MNKMSQICLSYISQSYHILRDIHRDILGWSHLRDIELSESSESDVGLIIGLKEKPTLFVPLECKCGGDNEPVAVRYSLGWTVIGPLSEMKPDEHCSVNFVSVKKKEIYVENRSLGRVQWATSTK